MHILILSLAYAPFSGVGAARMTTLSQYLLEKGEKVTVICYDSRIFGAGEQLREVPAGVQRIIVDKLPEKKENQNNLKNN